MTAPTLTALIQRVRDILESDSEGYYEKLRESSKQLADAAERLQGEVERLKPYESAIRNHLCEFDAADWLGCTFDHTSVAPCDICEHDKPHEHRALTLALARVAELEGQIGDVLQHLAECDGPDCLGVIHAILTAPSRPDTEST